MTAKQAAALKRLCDEMDAILEIGSPMIKSNAEKYRHWFYGQGKHDVNTARHALAEARKLLAEVQQ